MQDFPDDAPSSPGRPGGQVAPQGRPVGGLSLKGRALRLLAAREHSRLELERKLSAYEQEPGQLAQVLDALQAKDFINEGRVLESVVYRRAGRLGTARIRHELLHKGLSADAVNAAVQQLKSTELARARSVWQKKFGAVATTPAERAKQMRFLATRGFDTETIRKVVASAGDDI